MQARVPFANIESYQPAADYRKTGVIGVLEGRNFSWDASGVRADFASRLVSADNAIGVFGQAIHQLKVGDTYHVAVADKVYRLIPDAVGSFTGTWSLVHTLAKVQTTALETIPEHLRAFTTIFMGGFAYVCGWNYGVYRVDLTLNTYTRLTSFTTPGFPPDNDPVLAIAETNGRMVFITATAVYWSAPNDPENLVPALGGAGFQVIQEHMAGEPRAILRVTTGVLIWTAVGALAGEFIGGDAVFRWFQLTVEVMPLNQGASADVPDGSYIVITRLGLFRIVDLGQPQQLTPLFNEFLREYVRFRPIESGYLWYSVSDHRLFVSLKGTDSQFTETFCLDMSLDKWGLFSETHLGMAHYTAPRGPIAYCSSDGILSYLLATRDPRKDRENPYAPGTYTGLGSEVTVGYIRAEQIAPMTADSVQELQEIVIYRTNPLQGYQDTEVNEGAVTLAGTAPTFDEGAVGPGILFDEGVIGDGAVPTSYGLEIISDLFEEVEANGFDYGRSTGHLAHVGKLADTWTCMTPGYHFKLRLTAEIPGQFFRLNAVDCTLTVAGNLI